MSKCSKTTNNKYFNCPPRMDDGRHFTDYRPNCHSTNVITGNANIQKLNENKLEDLQKIRNRLFGLKNIARIFIKRKPKM